MEYEIGNYLMSEDILGSGGQGNVFLGIHKNTKKDVAVKCFDLNKKSVKLGYDNEVAAFANVIDEPGIIKLFECFEYDGTGIIVMERAKRDLLDYYLDANPSESRLKSLLFSIVKSVQTLHKNGVAHLDLKPENCLVLNNGEVKLCDFGNSMIFKEKQRYMGKRGSPGYVSPEMEEGRPFYPTAADVWALGVLFHVLITGYFPYSSEKKEGGFTELRFSRDTFNFKYLDDGSMTKDLISKMLSVDPKRRITIDEILVHPYFNSEKKSERKERNNNSISAFTKLKKQAQKLLQ